MVKTYTYSNQNLLQDTVVYGNFYVCDDISKTGGNKADARFKRNVLIGGDLTLGLETSTTTGGVTTYTDTSGSILFKLNGISYTITLTKLKYLSTITSDYATTISNITTNLSSNYITNSSLSTTLSNYVTTNSLNGNYSIGTTSSNLLTINSQLLATNGFFSPTLVYNAYTTDYNRFFGNFIMFYGFSSAPTGVQYLPIILAGKSTTVTIFNSTGTYTIQLSANIGSGIYGLAGIATYSSGASISLLPGYIYTFVIMYGANPTYDNWLCTVINTNNKLVDVGTDTTIGGTKTFSTAPLFSGTYPAGDNSTKLATTAWVKGLGYLSSVSLTGLANLNSPNFTGVPTSPTPAINDNSTQIATTEYVRTYFNPKYQYGVGGDITFTSGIYRYHIFKNSGTISFNKNSSSDNQINVFLVGGGGAGGNNHGGGGGAGDVLLVSYSTVTAGTVYTITVGNGGTSDSTNPIQAGTSSFIGGTLSAYAIGGGRGGGASNGRSSAGGSGGGGSGYQTSTDGGGTTTSSSFVNIGGNGVIIGGIAGGGGGGGGSGSAGINAPNNGVQGYSSGGAGGDGTNVFSLLLSIINSYMPSTWRSKTSTGTIASGGSGGSWGNPVVLKPQGGGGNGGSNNGAPTYPVTPPTNGENYTGGGGGGGGSGGQQGANGGCGLVVIYYIYSPYASIDDPTFTTKITTPYISCSSPVYTFLVGEYISNAQSTYTNSTPNVNYSTLSDIWGWSYSTNTNPRVYNRARLVNSVTSGYDTSIYGWSDIYGYWKAPNNGKYEICLTFYILTNVAGNRFRLVHNNSIGTLINSYYVLVEPTITTDVLRTYTNILNMSQGDYFFLELSTAVGAGISMYITHLQPNHTTLKVLQIC